MRTSIFRFKRFECSHGKGSMKIGVDAVLIGAWADVAEARKVLDVGTGCGVISLMCAQRNAECHIIGIDIDEASVREASENFRISPWSERLEAKLEDFGYIQLDNIDLIISNPPYFNSGVENPDTPRLMARHESALSPALILRKGVAMLSQAGRIAMVMPAERFEEICIDGEQAGLQLRRAMWIKGHPDAPVKRVLMEFEKLINRPDADSIEIPTLILECEPGKPTPEHRALCQDFYLKY